MIKYRQEMIDKYGEAMKGKLKAEGYTKDITPKIIRKVMRNTIMPEFCTNLTLQMLREGLLQWN